MLAAMRTWAVTSGCMLLLACLFLSSCGSHSTDKLAYQCQPGDGDCALRCLLLASLIHVAILQPFSGAHSTFFAWGGAVLDVPRIMGWGVFAVRLGACSTYEPPHDVHHMSISCVGIAWKPRVFVRLVGHMSACGNPKASGWWAFWFEQNPCSSGLLSRKGYAWASPKACLFLQGKWLFGAVRGVGVPGDMVKGGMWFKN